MSEKSKILVIGGTGKLGKFIVSAGARSDHPTFALVRESSLSNPAKSELFESYKCSGVTLLFGDLYDHESLVKAIKQVDVVISSVGHSLLRDQDRIIAAIKEAGNVKRFFPSEFGNDVDRIDVVVPAKTAYEIKAKLRRTIESEGIPYTYVCNFFFAGYFLSTLSQFGTTAPPRDKVIIMGDGNPKAVFNKEDDIGTYTIKAVDDPRTLNKILYVRPPKNIYSFNDLVSLWEKKIGKTLERIYVPEEEVLKNIKEASPPLNVELSISHSVYIKGSQTNFEIEPSFGVEASELYPAVKSVFGAKMFALGVVIKIPVPKQTAKTSFQVTSGRAKYNAATDCLIWKIRKFPGQTEPTMSAEVELISTMAEKKSWTRPPIQMEFQVPMFTASGLRVRFLKVWEKSGYNTVEWVRYITKAGSYEIRC